MQDYAGAWTAKRGRCHRLVYGSEDAHPTPLPGSSRGLGLAPGLPGPVVDLYTAWKGKANDKVGFLDAA